MKFKKVHEMIFDLSLATGLEPETRLTLLLVEPEGVEQVSFPSERDRAFRVGLEAISAIRTLRGYPDTGLHGVKTGLLASPAIPSQDPDYTLDGWEVYLLNSEKL